jgi:hypothetical protein
VGSNPAAPTIRGNPIALAQPRWPGNASVTVPWREAADLERRVFVHVGNSRLHTGLVLRGIDGAYTDTLAP